MSPFERERPLWEPAEPQALQQHGGRNRPPRHPAPTLVPESAPQTYEALKDSGFAGFARTPE